jgi:GntR family transcriptional regulator, rspAB operon transcriptional repressor
VPTKHQPRKPAARKPRGNGNGTRRAATAAKVIHRRLRADIVSMRRNSGEAVSEKEIAARHGVSRTPVREALLRLADERLIDIVPQSGTFVARIPVAALPEAIMVRKALEQLTAGLAARHAERSDIARLHDLLQTQRRTAAAGDRDRFYEADEAFHAAIADAAGYPGIWLLVLQVKMQVDRYRRLTLPVAGRMTQVVKEHKKIVAAIEARDPDGAAAAVAEHLDRLRASIGDVRDRYPDYFDAPAAAPFLSREPAKRMRG